MWGQVLQASKTDSLAMMAPVSVIPAGALTAPKGQPRAEGDERRKSESEWYGLAEPDRCPAFAVLGPEVTQASPRAPRVDVPCLHGAAATSHSVMQACAKLSRPDPSR
jgi:hypothetical protein